MGGRARRLLLTLGGALALRGAHAAEGPPAAPADGAPRLTGRLEAGPGRLFLQLGDSVVELTATAEAGTSGGGPGGPAADGREVRARITAGGRTTTLALRIGRTPAGVAPSR